MPIEEFFTVLMFENGHFSKSTSFWLWQDCLKRNEEIEEKLIEFVSNRFLDT